MRYTRFCVLTLAVLLLLSFSSCVRVTDNGDVSNESTTNISNTAPSAFLLGSTEDESAFGRMRSEFEYNSQGQLVKSSNFDNQQREYKREELYYDERGYLIEKVTTIFGENGNAASTTKTSFINNDDGLPVSGNETISNALNEQKVTFSYSYDETDRVISYIRESDGKIVQEETYEYLDDYGSYRWIVDDGIYEYRYDEMGNEISNTFTDELGVVTSSRINEYDRNNSLVKSVDNNGTITVYENTYNDNMLTESVIKVDGEITSVITYEYDGYGNVLIKKQTNAAGTVVSKTTNTWIALYD